MCEKAEKEVKDTLHKYYRLDMINHIGYIISIIIIVVGLLNLDVFLHFINVYKILIPVMTGIVFVVLTYLVNRIFHLSSYLSAPYRDFSKNKWKIRVRD